MIADRWVNGFKWNWVNKIRFSIAKVQGLDGNTLKGLAFVRIFSLTVRGTCRICKDVFELKIVSFILR